MKDHEFSVESVRKDFPILNRKMNGKALVYLDNAATTQKPQAVIQAVMDFYLKTNANVHRGVYTLSQEATEVYEAVRGKVCRFLGTKKEEEIIFTSGTTDAVNLVAHAWGRAHLKSGDDVIVTRMEHHSNFVPWQALAKEKGARFRIVELTPDYRIDIESFKEALRGRPKIVVITMMSNVLGVINPIKELATLAKDAGAKVFIDAAQGVAHTEVTVPALGPIDFLAFSSHKICGPSGVGVLWAREETLHEMTPYRYGGDMISRVRDETTDWNELPWKFEAGTPAMEGIVGFGAALDYLEKLGRKAISAHERELLVYALKRFKELKTVKVIGPDHATDRGAVISFTIEGIHPHDVATFLDSEGVAIRAGHHCAQPLLNKLCLPATNRASFLFYNTFDEVDVLIESIIKTQKYFESRARGVSRTSDATA